MNLPLWLRITLRLAGAAVICSGLWWIGARWFGISFELEDPAQAFATMVWFVFTFVVGLLILGLPVLGWMGGRLGNLYTPSDKQFRIRPEHSIAEGHAAVGRYREAIEQFRRDIEKFPDEATPHVRIAELSLERLGDADTAIAEFRAALDKAKNDDAFTLIAHRLADAYVGQKRDVAAAVEVLDGILQRYPHSKHALGARHRIQQLTEG